MCKAFIKTKGAHFKESKVSNTFWFVYSFQYIILDVVPHCFDIFSVINLSLNSGHLRNLILSKQHAQRSQCNLKLQHMYAIFVKTGKTFK